MTGKRRRADKGRLRLTAAALTLLILTAPAAWWADNQHERWQQWVKAEKLRPGDELPAEPKVDAEQRSRRERLLDEVFGRSQLAGTERDFREMPLEEFLQLEAKAEWWAGNNVAWLVTGLGAAAGLAIVLLGFELAAVCIAGLMLMVSPLMSRRSAVGVIRAWLGVKDWLRGVKDWLRGVVDEARQARKPKR